MKDLLAAVDCGWIHVLYLGVTGLVQFTAWEKGVSRSSMQ